MPPPTWPSCLDNVDALPLPLGSDLYRNKCLPEGGTGNSAEEGVPMVGVHHTPRSQGRVWSYEELVREEGDLWVGGQGSDLMHFPFSLV